MEPTGHYYEFVAAQASQRYGQEQIFLVQSHDVAERRKTWNQGTYKNDEVDLSEYLDFADAARQIGHFIEDVYMTKRIHSSLGYLTPAEFELAFRLAQTQDALTSP